MPVPIHSLGLARRRPRRRESGEALNNSFGAGGKRVSGDSSRLFEWLTQRPLDNSPS
jgi:hypothetical protein